MGTRGCGGTGRLVLVIAAAGALGLEVGCGGHPIGVPDASLARSSTDAATGGDAATNAGDASVAVADALEDRDLRAGDADSRRPSRGQLGAATLLQTAGAWPLRTALADLDGDGDLDIAVGDVTGTFVSVMINVGGGAFAPAVAYDVGGRGGGNWIEAGDVDDDGRPELALSVYNDPDDAAAGTHTVVLRNAGNGTFGAAKKVGDGRVIAFADLDADGKADLLVANGGDVIVLLNEGQGASFRAAGTYPVGFDAGTAAVGDLNHDGKPDLAVTTSNDLSLPTGLADFGNVVVLLNTGAGAFLKAATHPVARGADFVRIADVSGDGAPDLVAAESLRGGGEPDVLYVLTNKGDGSFADPVPHEIGSPGGGQTHLVARDFDRDGKVDLAVAGAQEFPDKESIPVVRIFRNRGGGTFEPATAHHVPVPASLAAGDLNGDGALDLVFTSDETGWVGALLGRHDGTFPPGPAFTEAAASAFATGDIDRDGKPDIAVTSGSMALSFNLGGKEFSVLDALLDDENAAAKAIAIADLNSDGKVDLANASAGARVFLGQGGTAFVTGGVGYPTRVAPELGTPEAIVAGDVNGDGDADLVILDTALTGASNAFAEPLSVLLNKGDGTFAPPVTYGVKALRARAGSLALADVNGDKAADIVVAAGASALCVLLNDGHGTFLAPVSYGAFAPSWLAVGDLNGDGKPDLAYVDSGVPTIRLNDGTGAFGPASIAWLGMPNAKPSSEVVSLGDLNDDGKLDLLIGVDRMLAVALGRGDGKFAPPTLYLDVGRAPLAGLSTADFDGDGHADVALLSSTGFSIFYNEGP